MQRLWAAALLFFASYPDSHAAGIKKTPPSGMREINIGFLRPEILKVPHMNLESLRVLHDVTGGRIEPAATLDLIETALVMSVEHNGGSVAAMGPGGEHEVALVPMTINPQATETRAILFEVDHSLTQSIRLNDSLLGSLNEFINGNRSHPAAAFSLIKGSVLDQIFGLRQVTYRRGYYTALDSIAAKGLLANDRQLSEDEEDKIRQAFNDFPGIARIQNTEDRLKTSAAVANVILGQGIFRKEALLGEMVRLGGDGERFKLEDMRITSPARDVRFLLDSSFMHHFYTRKDDAYAIKLDPVWLDIAKKWLNFLSLGTSERHNVAARSAEIQMILDKIPFPYLLANYPDSPAIIRLEAVAMTIHWMRKLIRAEFDAILPPLDRSPATSKELIGPIAEFRRAAERLKKLGGKDKKLADDIVTRIDGSLLADDLRPPGVQ